MADNVVKLRPTLRGPSKVRSGAKRRYEAEELRALIGDRLAEPQRGNVRELCERL